MTIPRLAVGAPAPARLLDPTRAASCVAWLVLGCVAAAAGAAALTASTSGGAAVVADADLARLLRAMAVVKALLLALAVGALGWRLQRPVAMPFLVAYLALPWLAAASLGAMWQLAALGVVTIVLHAAGVALVVAAWRDPDFLPTRR